MEIHPTVLVKGYRMAEVQAQKILKNLTKSVSLEDEEMLRNIVITAMTGKGAEANKEVLSELILRAVKLVAAEGRINLSDIKVETIVGEGVDNSELVQGIVLDKERVHASMPERMENAKIALLDAALEIKNTK